MNIYNNDSSSNSYLLNLTLDLTEISDTVGSSSSSEIINMGNMDTNNYIDQISNNNDFNSNYDDSNVQMHGINNMVPLLHIDIQMADIDNNLISFLPYAPESSSASIPISISESKQIYELSESRPTYESGSLPGLSNSSSSIGLSSYIPESSFSSSGSSFQPGLSSSSGPGLSFQPRLLSSSAPGSLSSFGPASLSSFQPGSSSSSGPGSSSGSSSSSGPSSEPGSLSVSGSSSLPIRTVTSGPLPGN